MIAEVYPLVRLPRGKTSFDYLIGNLRTVHRGCYVRIPYRKREVWGIVRRLKDKPPRGIELKQLLDCYRGVELREEELSFFEHLAVDLAQSIPSLLFAALPRPPMRVAPSSPQTLSWLPLTLPRSEADQVVRVVYNLKNKGKAFIQTPDLRRATAVILGYLQKRPETKALILVPTLRDVRLLRVHLTGYEPFIITGEESNAERFYAWRAFRSQKSGILLGTRTALLSIDSSITTIFLLRSGDRFHKQRDRNPRYDAREAVWQHHEQFHSHIFCFDVAPGPLTMKRFEKSERINWGMYPMWKIVDRNQEKQPSVGQIITYSVGQAIEEVVSQGRQVLVIYNHKGRARESRCSDCGHRFLCASCHIPLMVFSHTLECARCRYKEPIAHRCPSCKGDRIFLIGPGNEEVARELRNLFPHSSIAMIDKEHREKTQADILLVTTFYYEAYADPFKNSRIGLVVVLDVDSLLYQEGPQVVENVLRDLWQWAWLAFGNRAPILIQTASRDFVESVMYHPFETAAEELEASMRYHAPPVYRWCRILYKEDERRKAEIAMNQLAQLITSLLGAVIHPIRWNANGHAYLDCGIATKSFDSLLQIFTKLPDSYIIDTNMYT